LGCSYKNINQSKTVELTSGNIQTWGDITAQPLVENKQYFITYLSNNWNVAYPKTGTNFTYPIAKSNVIVLAYDYAISAIGAVPKYPTFELKSYIAIL